MKKVEIKYIKLKDIKPYENNPRKNDEAVDYVANSIREFGFKNPIVLDKNNVIVNGHTRYKASKKLKLKEVPCIYADDLTEEQIKAFRIADNKVGELAEWDFDKLDLELEDINLDMEDFGIEFVTELEHEEYHDRTQHRVENILNLGYEMYKGENTYDIPEIEPLKSVGDIKEWIPFNYVLSDKDPTGKAVHFYIDDYQFERLWKNPDKYIEKLKQYVAVASPDFSPYGNMPLATQIFNHYRKHWVAKYLQDRGVNIIPTIRASTDERSFDFYLQGEPKNGIVTISSMWTNDENSLQYFLREYNTMYDTLKPIKVYLYGKKVDGLRGNIEIIETNTSKIFGGKDGKK